MGSPVIMRLLQYRAAPQVLAGPTLVTIVTFFMQVTELWVKKRNVMAY